MNEINYEDIINNLEASIVRSQEIHNDIITKLSHRLNCELRESVQLESESVSYRQTLLDERSKFLFKIYKEMIKIKKLRKTQFEYYASKYQIKTNSGEKNRLVDADLADIEGIIEFLDGHVSFINDSIKTLDHVIWSLKNKIQIHNILGEE